MMSPHHSHSPAVPPPYVGPECSETTATSEGQCLKAPEGKPQKQQIQQLQEQQSQGQQPQQRFQCDKCLKAPEGKPQKQQIQQLQEQQSQGQQPQQRFQCDKSKQQVMNRFRENLRHLLPLTPEEQCMYIPAMLKELKAWACKNTPAHSDNRKGFQAETKLLWDMLANVPLTTENRSWILELMDTFADLMRWNWPLGHGIEAAPFLTWFRQCLQKELHLDLEGGALTRLWYSFGKLCKSKLPAAIGAIQQKEEDSQPRRKPAASAKVQENDANKQLGAIAKALGCFASLIHRICGEQKAVTQEEAEAVARQLGERWVNCEAVAIRRATLLQVAHRLFNDLVMARLLELKEEAVVADEVEFAGALLHAVDKGDDWREVNLQLTVWIARQLHGTKLGTEHYYRVQNALRSMLPEKALSKLNEGPQEDFIEHVATLE